MATVVEQSRSNPPTPGTPSIGGYSSTDQAVLDNGSSFAAWLVRPAASNEIHARTQNREGTTLGPDTTILNVPATIEVDEWAVTALGDGAIFFWTERSEVAGVQIRALRYRTMSASGVLGAIQQLDFASVPTTDGRISLTGLSASSGGDFANVAWTLVDRRGPASSNCDAAGIFDQTTGPCQLIEKVRFARFASNGSVATGPGDLLSRNFTSENTDCPVEENAAQSNLLTTSDGTATALIRDYCRPQGGEATPVLLHGRVPVGGQVSPAKLLDPFSPQYIPFIIQIPIDLVRPSISSDGTMTFNLNGGVFRVSKNGQLTGPILDVEEVGEGWTGRTGPLVALPGGRTLALILAKKLSGENLTRAVWSRIIEADGSLTKPKQLYSRTWSSSTPGYPKSTFLDIKAAGGLGKDTGTVLIDVLEIDRQSATSASQNDQVIAIGLNGKGARSGSPTVLQTASGSFSPSTDQFLAATTGEVKVASDGTASVLLEKVLTKYVIATNIGSASFQLLSTKLVRNPNTCGVTPSLCKANVKVKGLKVSGRGSKTKLTITLKNSGNKDASKVKAKLTASGGAKTPKTVSFPKVLEGKAAKKTVKVSGSGTIKVKVGKSSKTIRF
ncbi:MAG: hypothetical protein ACKOB2_01895 [Solirubrobacterales bacterium]